jgi:hypothetical protein
MSYSKKLKNPKWQRKRLEILQRDDFKCTLCGDTERELHVHHKSYEGDPWDIPNGQLITVCDDCHKITHELEDMNIVKVAKMVVEQDHSIYVSAYTSTTVTLLIMFAGSPPVLQDTFPLSLLDFIHNNKPV